MVPRFAVVLSLLLVFSVRIQAQTVREELQVRETLSRFVRAFDDLDWETFRLTFDDGATVFYPRAFPERATGVLNLRKPSKTYSNKFATAGPQRRTWVFSQEK
jgi:hypothetical protein